MFTTVGVYEYINPTRKRFVTDMAARINIPVCPEDTPAHLNLQIGVASIHIPLEDLRELIDNAVMAHKLSSLVGNGKIVSIKGGIVSCPTKKN